MFIEIIKSLLKFISINSLFEMGKNSRASNPKSLKIVFYFRFSVITI